MAGLSLREPDMRAALQSAFSVAVGPSAGPVPVQEVTFFDAVQLTLNFDQGDQITFTVPSFAPEAYYLDELATDVWLAGQLRQRFRIVSLTQDWDEHGNDIIAVTGICYKRMMRARHVLADLTYTNVDQGEIVWNLVAHTQAQPGGQLGITKGAVTTGVHRDRTYIPGNNIAQMLTNLTEVLDGPHWHVDGDRLLTVRMPADFDRHPQPLQRGVTARKLSRNSTAEDFANADFVDGGEGTVPVIATVPDIATDPRGRWEKAAGFPTVIVQSTLQEHAEGLLEQSVSPPAVWTAEVEPYRWQTDARYMPGDFVLLLVPRSTAAPIGAPNRAVEIQIIESQIGLTSAGATTVRVTGVEVAAVDLGAP